MKNNKDLNIRRLVNQLNLVSSYFKMASRVLWKNKSYSLTNIFGLTLGVTIFILNACFVKFQLSFDQFHQNKDTIFRLTTNQFAKVPGLCAPGLEESFPEVLNYARLQQTGRILINKGVVKFYDSDGLYADSSFFDIFSLQLLEGNPKTALVNPYSIVITFIEI